MAPLDSPAQSSEKPDPSVSTSDEEPPSPPTNDRPTATDSLIAGIAVLADVSAVVNVYTSSNSSNGPAIVAMTLGGAQLLIAGGYLGKSRPRPLSRARKWLAVLVIVVGVMALATGLYRHQFSPIDDRAAQLSQSSSTSRPSPSVPSDASDAPSRSAVTSDSTGTNDPRKSVGKGPASTETDTAIPPTTGTIQPAEVVFDSPSPDNPPKIDSGGDVPVSGSVRGLTYGELWIVTKPVKDWRYWIIQNEPILVRNGRFEFIDREVGNEDDEGWTIEYKAYEADKACADKLRAAKSTIDTIPSGCTPIGRGVVEVNKRPAVTPT